MDKKDIHLYDIRRILFGETVDRFYMEANGEFTLIKELCHGPV